MLIDDYVRELVQRIELTDIKNSESLASDIRQLIQRLRSNLQDPQILERYKAYKKNTGTIGQYPIDSDGFAASYDPLEDEQGFWDVWSRYGIVVGKHVVSEKVCAHAIKRMHEIIRDISGGACELDEPGTWKNVPVDRDGVPFISRGFFEVYHDKALSDIRQSIRLYIHHVLIWGRVDLWTSFDRLGVKLPGHEESYALPLHVDQNPRVHPDFKTVQGVVALAPCPKERGTFVGVPGSRSVFSEYARFAPEKGEFVELSLADPVAENLAKNMQLIPLRSRDIISWDSRTTHANSENTSKETRYVAYVSAGPTREESQELIDARMEAFRSGIGSNLREALMHASKKSRYSDYEKLEKVREPEQLTFLGSLLYGQETYEKI